MRNVFMTASDFWRAKAEETLEALKEFSKERIVKLPEKNEITIPDLFNAEDFEDLDVALCRFLDGRYPQDKTDLMSRTAKSIANARFREWAEGLTKVYTIGTSSWWQDMRGSPPSSVALLAFPQEIQKAECEHAPSLVVTVNGCGASNTCLKCGAKLKAKWEAAE